MQRVQSAASQACPARRGVLWQRFRHRSGPRRVLCATKRGRFARVLDCRRSWIARQVRVMAQMRGGFIVHA